MTFKAELLLLLSAALAQAFDPAVIKLPELNIEGSVTASGLSSGAFMAVQMHIAHSKVINGTAIFAGGGFFCAQGSLLIAEEKCMYGLLGGPSTEFLIEYTRNQAVLKTIDSPTNLLDDKVFIFSGSKDTVVSPNVVRELEDYYKAFVKPSNILSKYDLSAEHCIPTLDYGEKCSTLSSPYIGDCAYDGAGVALQQLYAGLTAPTSADYSKSSNLYAFSQTEFFPTGTSGQSISLGDTGYIYIPTACADKVACRLHMSFHGCSQNLHDIGNDYALNGGFNGWAEANNVVIVYPYALANVQLGNPNACWDWWGYTDAFIGEFKYTLQSGPQMQFAKSMLDRVMGTA
ncbi:Alpha/Beta hydrolase protein [Ochromonadaceae sp. CCMP2298]|nr:Alpha/Beta hydrolase protein [Ochromonadaceae sp. CCMP2298]|mmetsp:Transcript_30073/g.66559  ORF Transcript_30073/g.66559 Transcript_30073/m.66559 type:complete len:345 (+) Transcript_30073:84-1118(+)